MATKKTTTAKTTKTTGKGSAKGSAKGKGKINLAGLDDIVNKTTEKIVEISKRAKRGADKDYDAAPGAAKDYDAAKPAHPLGNFHDFTTAYTNALRAQGTTPSTIASYSAELHSAAKYFAEGTNPLAISADWLEKYFESAQVTQKRDGSPRSQLTIDKTRRALRMALEWARDEMGCEVACNDALRPAKPGELVKEDAPATPAAPKKRRARKGAITLEVSQQDAEAAADWTEAEFDKRPPQA